ncbi:MAG: CRISPR-associated endonuclease Cas2 [candidate division WWE3 bacterium]|nr:CRISPR-associated endonuclease Cas2 [candidate division WWE3 bacterium]
MPRIPDREKIAAITRGIVSTLSDYLLIQAYFGVELMFAGYGSRNVYRASERAWEQFFASKGKSAKRALYCLKSEGLVTYARGGGELAITEVGIKRLRATIPFYDEKRTWDGKLYLITFDIPEEKKQHREVLRKYLKKIGCGMLQLSVWITPHDPRETLRNFITQSGSEGMVVVSDVGRDGSIGDGDIKVLVAKVYKLDELNERYGNFIRQAKAAVSTLEELKFVFLSILKEDSQLPFALLPKDWLGNKAYNIYTNLMRSR